MPDEPVPTDWWARGLLFENCSCQVVCPGHIHFDQDCTYERCLGYWAIVVHAGAFGRVPLDGVKAVVAFNSPRRMIDGGWTQRLIVGESATLDQRGALEQIVLGRAGGPWAVLARFVATHLDTLFLPIEVREDGKAKELLVDGVVEARVEPIRGRDRSQVVTFENCFNQIHAPTQVIAMGDTRYDDGVISMANERSHGLYSHFSWGP